MYGFACRSLYALVPGLLALAVALTAAAPADAAGPSKRPRISSADCRAASDCDRSGAGRPGAVLRLRGRNFTRGSRVTFYGARGGADNVRRSGRRRSSRTFDVRIPDAAVSGRIAIRPRRGARSPYGPRVSIALPTPAITSAGCRSASDCDSAGAARPGTIIRLRGRHFTGGSTVTFYGRRGAADNTRRMGSRKSASTFDVRVPEAAVSGRIAIRAPGGPRSALGPRVTVAVPPPAANQKSAQDQNYVFPVRGAHNYGGDQSRFGASRGGRSHQGHDVFARTGTPLVAARGGKVAWKRYQGSGAGHYLVIRGDDGTDYVYMHMRTAALVSEGQTVTTGQPIGEVGCTGSCSGAHLHFEMWTAHWYDGGRPFDPLPYLKRWDSYS